MTTFVVDVSVAAKWLLPASDEPLAKEAHRMLLDFKQRDTNFIVPDLFWAELANVLWKAVRKGRTSREVAQHHMAELQSLHLPTFPSFEFASSALGLAVKYNRTAYDSFYLALALETHSTFITADERLANAVAAYLPVRWLGSLY